MKKHIKIVITAMLMLALAVCAFAPAAFAQEAIASVALNGSIELTDHPDSFSEDYTIVLTAEDSAAPMPEGSADGVCEAVVAAGEFTLPAINFTDLGVYKYTVAQKAGSADRWTYDDSIYHVTVYVTNSESGNGTDVHAAVYKNDETVKSEIIFTNTYDPAPVTVTLTALKTLQGDKLTDGRFSFELKDEEGNLIQTASCDANGDIRFDGITFEETGTYVYLLTEVNTGEKLVQYDTSSYRIVLTVIQDGDLVASVTYEKNGSAYDGAEPAFINIITPPPGDTTNIAIWVALFAISAVAVIALAVLGKKRRDK